MNQWTPISSEETQGNQPTRKSLTYWQDVWRRLRQNVMAMTGLVMILIISGLAIFGPMFSPYSYSEQNLQLANIAPQIEITKITDKDYVFVHNEYRLVSVTADGKFIGAPEVVDENKINRYITYNIDGKEVKFDYSLAMSNRKKGQKVTEEEENADMKTKYDIFVDGEKIDKYDTKIVLNKTNIMGTDTLGRDVWTRVLYGARISLTVGLVASVVNLCVGVVYGGIAGYEGGKVDNIMMRIVDIISSVPLLLIVILLMVIIEPGLKTIIITIGMVYWVGMARLVRGQVLSLKEQEFVLAARALGVTKSKIIIKHLIPNAIGPIVVSMMMSIPSAIFTEAFLSFIGLGVSAPEASWGTLANDALGGIRSYPYQLIIPSIAIALTMFAFNFLGDGLRDALDPRLRK
ncbi:peptide ABC transporter permease [Candidatus Epulonipiscium fishelsonii]|uniref:Peptide ABC transporter permease n=1 Tax=Candidatus Epulonipiscium fishelsonii TaxID=77094 RepID=A0ACC8X980_9FIRM|nr:peptide ABC transporter permease [Epulopiscium sp. SCG-B11WGA-EpuloA1]ONI39917.1 peptide ABC transporter permease [Epulopiscium sp. SCG-B05WGA-EpuloA1]